MRDVICRTAVASVLALLLGSGPATASKGAWEEYSELVKGAQTIAPVGPTLFGDEVSLQHGTLSFRVTDVSLRGNSALPVAVTRTFRTRTAGGAMRGTLPGGNQKDGAMGDWEIDLPHVGGVFTRTTGWVNGVAGRADRRCSVANTAECPHWTHQ